MLHLPFILLAFIFGACVGSFLNVVVWRLPRGESLTYPPSHCPRCNNRLPWYDNLPVIGWLKLGGKCRFCQQPISMRYPVIEAITGLLFAFYYVMFFVLQTGPCAARPLDIVHDWPMYGLAMAMVAGLLAASLIDAEMFIIPIEIPWVIGALGVIVHTIIDRPSLPGSLNLAAEPAALAVGGAVGLLITLALWSRGIIPVSFPDGEPMQDLDEADLAAIYEREGKVVEYESKQPPQPADPPKVWTRRELMVEMRKEMAFLLPPMLLAAGWWFLTVHFASVHNWWEGLMEYHWLTGLLGAVFGALVGAFVVWITRILGTIGFGRLAMGLGDVHLMFGVGAVIGAGAATVTFFLAPFFGIVLAIYMLLTGKKREIPYGPYLSLAAAFVLLFYCPIAAWLAPGMQGVGVMIRGTMHIG